MASTIINGLVNSFKDINNKIYVTDINKEKVEKLRDGLNINLCENNTELVKRCDIIFLAIKPNAYQSVLKEIKSYMNNEKLIISMMAGVTIDDIKQYFKQPVKIIRIMPNVGVTVNEGMIALNGGDKEPNSDIYNVTAEFVDAKNTAGGGAQQQTEQGLQSVLLETKGVSVFDAIRKMIKISAKRPYLAHATTIVISEEAAREGIVPFLDLVVTHEEPRLDVDVYVARGKLAGEILHTKSFSSDIRSFELSQIVNENKQLVRIPILKAYEIINQLATPKFSIVLPVVTSFINHGESTNILSGGAVFKTDKLVGFLEQEDIIPYLFIKDQIQSAVLNVETKEGNLNSTITLETHL